MTNTIIISDVACIAATEKKKQFSVQQERKHSKLADKKAMIVKTCGRETDNYRGYSSVKDRKSWKEFSKFTMTILLCLRDDFTIKTKRNIL